MTLMIKVGLQFITAKAFYDKKDIDILATPIFAIL